MCFPQDQIDELKLIAPLLSVAEEGGYTYILIEKLMLPDGCEPSIIDALLCPTPTKDGYNSRLFFSDKISGCPERNWNGSIRVLERNWVGISWQTRPEEKRLLEILQIHLSAFR